MVESTHSNIEISYSQLTVSISRNITYSHNNCFLYFVHLNRASIHFVSTHNMSRENKQRLVTSFSQGLSFSYQWNYFIFIIGRRYFMARGNLYSWISFKTWNFIPNIDFNNVKRYVIAYIAAPSVYWKHLWRSVLIVKHRHANWFSNRNGKFISFRV